MTSAKREDWKEICKAATEEMDSDKLMALIEELMKALDSLKPQPSRQASGA